MLQNYNSLQPSEGENVENTGNSLPGEDNQLSDTQKVVRRHMQDQDHVITDEEMRNIQVGSSIPKMDAPTAARFGDDEKKEEVEREFVGDEDRIEEDENSKGDKLTPWDTIENE